MRYLEHWTHRLFPKMPFDEVLERIERLGTKREVQVIYNIIIYLMLIKKLNQTLFIYVYTFHFF